MPKTQKVITGRLKLFEEANGETGQHSLIRVFIFIAPGHPVIKN